MKTIFYTMCLVALLASCTKDINNSNDETNNDYLNAGEIFAKTLASSINSEELYSYICNKASEKFDGDYNFLIVPNLEQVSAKSVSNKTFKELLIQSNSTTKSGDAINIEALLSEIEQKHPLQQIYVMNSHLLNEQEDIPLVVYLPDDFDQNVTKYVNAYDAQGNVIKLDAKGEYEDEVMLVVSQNERTLLVSNEASHKSIGAKDLELVYSNHLYSYYIQNNKSTQKSIVQSSSVDRDRSSGRDYIHSIRINGRSAWTSIEAAFKGDPELYVYAYYGKRILGNLYKGETLKKVGITGNYGRRGKINTVYPNLDMFIWDNKENGDNVKYAWYEQDGGLDTGILSFNFEINVLGVPVGTGQGAVHVLSNDDPAGESIVYYNDKYGSGYNTGVLTFTIHAK